MKKLELEELNKITEAIIGAAIEVHRHLGPGLLESLIANAYDMNYCSEGILPCKKFPCP